MTQIAYFEPSYTAHNARDWEIRGSYKYPSLLGDLHTMAKITLLMPTLPPETDPHRIMLETNYDVRFVALDTLDDAGDANIESLVEDYATAIANLEPDIVSTLNGRMIGHNFALARAAKAVGKDFVYRIAGNDIATQIAVREAAGRPVTGTAYLATLIAQERYAAEVARSVIVMGGTERERAAGRVADPSKIHICRRGVDQSHFTPAANASKSCNRILFVGRNSAEKGIDLIEGAADMLAKTRPEIEFTVAGDFDPRTEGNRHYLGFHGYADLPTLYQDHDALLLPARSEGFPQVVMEAMSCGLPAILSKSLFEHDFGAGDGVTLIDRDVRSIVDAISSWHDDDSLFAKVRSEAIGQAKEHFDATENGEHYHTILLGQGK
ncbi:glycosyltransferase [Parasphingopyxis sp. CP4]|uniref:glycosyltransferase family 4 protein n=1 Tax=Parasphingopyxis sp. CP4 TaxID=2724527 RepID=UPI0015A3D78C|nr:glycosyltransferase [Parasphingopyxis sp. CP4]QLC21324.1 glycosyltransferase [Parasphingopyxis sp. CP4]